jgi:hypothetical protein
MRRGPALLVSVVIVAATVWPALRDPPRDSFPLSNYPMFSAKRGVAWLDVVVGFDAAGESRPIPPRLVASFEVMQASETIRHAVRRRQARRLCDDVAARVAADERHADVVRLEVQSRRFDPATYFADAGGRAPSKLRVRARCAVGSGPEEGAS